MFLPFSSCSCRVLLQLALNNALTINGFDFRRCGEFHVSELFGDWMAGRKVWCFLSETKVAWNFVVSGYQRMVCIKKDGEKKGSTRPDATPIRKVGDLTCFGAELCNIFGRKLKREYEFSFEGTKEESTEISDQENRKSNTVLYNNTGQEYSTLAMLWKEIAMKTDGVQTKVMFSISWCCAVLAAIQAVLSYLWRWQKRYLFWITILLTSSQRYFLVHSSFFESIVWDKKCYFKPSYS